MVFETIIIGAAVIFEARDLIAGGRFLQEVRISTFQSSSERPEGIRYSLCLMELASGKGGFAV
jgi:hypothetical protein